MATEVAMWWDNGSGLCFRKAYYRSVGILCIYQKVFPLFFFPLVTFMFLLWSHATPSPRSSVMIDLNVITGFGGPVPLIRFWTWSIIVNSRFTCGFDFISGIARPWNFMCLSHILFGTVSFLISMYPDVMWITHSGLFVFTHWSLMKHVLMA